MECNKDEAIKAMDIAKKKVAENDYNGAKKFAEKAQNLYPKIDGLKQVLMLIDVYISAGNKLSGGETDWYAILGVDPLADDDAVKKQYKKLALLLHPDKNKCEGAEGAFKLVLEAWSLLSDKIKRIAFDQKRKSREVKPKKSRKQKPPAKHQKPPPNQQNQPPDQQKPPPNQKQQPQNQQKQPPNQKQQPPHQPKQPPNQPKQPPNQQKQQPPDQQKQQPPNQPSSNGSRNGRGRSNKPTMKVSTFWTMCIKCKTEYEYVRVFFLNKNVLCQNCRETFKATEKEKTPQATNENTNGASSCGRDPSQTVSVGCSFPKMGSFNCGDVANQEGEDRVKREGTESQEKDEEYVRGISNSDGKVEERVFKKLKTDDFDFAEATSSGIEV